MPSLTAGAEHAADQDVTRRQPVAVAAPLWWPDHPLAAGRPDQPADIEPQADPVSLNRSFQLVPLATDLLERLFNAIRGSAHPVGNWGNRVWREEPHKSQ
jgi:hypothetical protein